MENKLNFEEFRDFGSRLSSNYIGITGNGTISFYSGFYKKNGIDKFSHCIILLDRAKLIVGIQLGGSELGDGAWLINHNKERGTATVSGRNFFQKNDDLPIDKYKGKYIPEKYSDEDRKNVFLIDLNKKV
jgi:hypothetical protein